ncbi:REX1BD-like protein, implicated in DNA repair [Schizosaccharomyces osmophilus]|uniref:REX1BD-like protein, implicated in DNA repair n=1 Tax=Schizosaccharomyces osmophilus TaxID=2545709 RepID=A0AAE9WFF6_9SCHI|nr:REX1BD-like protein, implicated in DNA repair [Schizosaccharomyces osmophilus]WBW75180.1 REX1BD-like protein, implicated in DNA repair [Schizosaccharomyces osmophilus]
MEETVQKIFKAQDTRTQLYKEFEEALKANHEKTIGLEQMGIVVQLVTEGLNEVSLDIRKLQASLSSPQLQSYVDQLQGLEQSKLQKTIKIEQLSLPSNIKDHSSETEQLKEEINALILKINDTIQSIKDEL